jgi:hypothetical protein
MLDRFRRVIAPSSEELTSQTMVPGMTEAAEPDVKLELLDVIAFVEDALSHVEASSDLVRSERAQEHLESAQGRLRRVVDFLTK